MRPKQRYYNETSTVKKAYMYNVLCSCIHFCKEHIVPIQLQYYLLLLGVHSNGESGNWMQPRLIQQLLTQGATNLSPGATTSCKSTQDTVPYFGVNGLSMIFCLSSLLHPLTKWLAIEDNTKSWRNNFEWEGGGRSVLYLTDLWPGAICSKKGRFFMGVSQHFCNWL